MKFTIIALVATSSAQNIIPDIKSNAIQAERSTIGKIAGMFSGHAGDYDKSVNIAWRNTANEKMNKQLEEFMHTES